MGAPVLLTPAEWEAVKVASLRGVPDADLARQFGVEQASIRKRRSRDAMWAAACGGVQIGKGVQPEGRQGGRKPPSQETVTKLQNVTEMAEKAAESVTLSLAERGEICRNRLLQLAQKGIEKAHKTDLPVTSWQDAKTITEIAAKAAGWDKAEAQVSVNIWGSGMAGGVMCREVGPAEIEAEMADEEWI